MITPDDNAQSLNVANDGKATCFMLEFAWNEESDKRGSPPVQTVTVQVDELSADL